VSAAATPEGGPDPERVDIAARLTGLFGEGILQVEEFRGDLTVRVAREGLHDVLAALKLEPDLDFAFLMDVTAVDHLALGRTPRFDVVYHLYSSARHRRLRVKCRVGEDDAWVPTASDVWQGADWFERETWDMFGIVFEGHPNLRRILCHEDFEGHPLRKDFPADKRFFLPRPASLRDQAPDWVLERTAGDRAAGFIPD
jgi:NADH-quinone oxidoreductase subunit C